MIYRVPNNTSTKVNIVFSHYQTMDWTTNTNSWRVLGMPPMGRLVHTMRVVIRTFFAYQTMAWESLRMSNPIPRCKRFIKWGHSIIHTTKKGKEKQIEHFLLLSVAIGNEGQFTISVMYRNYEHRNFHLKIILVIFVRQHCYFFDLLLGRYYLYTVSEMGYGCI